MSTFKHLIPVGPGMWNIRSTFPMMHGLIDIGTHMSIIQLSSGRFMIVDTVGLTPELKAEIDLLTQNGTLMECVIATHPYHTVFFKPFYEAYPQPKYFGTPRHLRIQPEIPWEGDVNVECTRKRWEPDVYMRIPAGSEFVNPLPPTRNHFSNVFVFHPQSRTVHNDDTICFSCNPGFLMRLAGFKEGTMMFHRSIKGPGLYPNSEAPFQFRQWVVDMMNDWDFDNILSAHNGNKIGGAKQLLQETLKKAEPLLSKLSEKNSKNPIPVHDDSDEPTECG